VPIFAYLGDRAECNLVDEADVRPLGVEAALHLGVPDESLDCGCRAREIREYHIPERRLGVRRKGANVCGDVADFDNLGEVGRLLGLRSRIEFVAPEIAAKAALLALADEPGGKRRG
jgi:hypothetical protein